jgi:hypothetical protein
VVDRQLRVGLFCHRRGDRVGRRARCVDEVVEQVHHIAGSFNVREVPNAGEHLELGGAIADKRCTTKVLLRSTIRAFGALVECQPG